MEKNMLALTFRHARWVAAALALLLALTYLLSGVYAVRPEQTGVVKRFGRIAAADIAPGIHYRLPWPIDTVELVNTREVRTLKQEYLNTDIVPVRDYESILLTGDENLVTMSLLVNYTIADPGRYLSATVDPDGILQRLIAAECVGRLAATGIDDTLAGARNRLQSSVRDSLNAKINDLELGLAVASVQIAEVRPPDAVESAFKDVASAREDKQRLVQEATGDRNRRLPQARAEAERSLREAEAEAQERVERAHGDANGFLAQWEEYRRVPGVTARRLYLETMETVLDKVDRKHLITPERGAKK